MSEANRWQNPERVEPGQVWDHLGEAHGGDGCKEKFLVVREVRESPSLFQVVFHNWITAGQTALARWRCIGFEVAPGRRVMVGEVFRQSDAGMEWTVDRVLQHGRIDLVAPGCTWSMSVTDLLAGWHRVQQMPTSRWTCDEHVLSLPVGSCCPMPHSLATATGPTLDAMAARVGIDAERWRREAPRREIDKLLAEDARQHPDYAAGRAGAVRNAVGREGRHGAFDDGVERARKLLVVLHGYESVRGHRRDPSDAAMKVAKAAGETIVCADYERARGCR